ncbi:hypothetical protein [Chryseobacterium sp. UNC8MFCol]|uniref:hypothetical protein n=1 Tax=Chryseobacterium sp. UNC8MFCol TaxID=1340435 RepID=UPI000483FCAE|nr:hypothetical protein [Chryseobacterium sp. UNC8MFCol]
MYDKLEQLFYRGELEQCIAEGEAYLLSHPDDEEILFLMAIASHDNVYYDGHEAVFDAIQEKMLPYFRRVLQLNPNHQKTLYSILSYPLDNQYTLAQIGKRKKHITEDNKEEFISYAEQMLDDSENAVFGYDFLVKIYESLEHNKVLLNSLEAGIYFFQKEFADNRELRDRNTSLFWIKKIYLLDREKMISGADLTAMIERDHTTFVSRNEYDFMNLADIAYENGTGDLSLKMMLKAIKGENSAVHIQEKLVDWYHRFTEMVQKGFNHPDVFYYQLIIERSYPDLLNITEDFYYHHALEVINIHPENFSGYHFAGTYLYEKEQYSEAVPLLEKAVQLSFNATSWRRKVESEYYLYGSVPAEVPAFTDYPSDIYNEGVFISDFIDEIENDKETTEWVDVSRQVYERAYHAFRRYYEEGKFESDYYNDLHTRAMCCNNLAIRYSLSGDAHAAAVTASEGLQYSEFGELHLVLIDALLDGEDYENGAVALKNYFHLYDECEDFYYKNLYNRARQLEVHGILGTYDIYADAQEMLISLYQHTIDNSEIDEDDYRDLEAAKNTLERILYERFETEESITRQSYYENIAKQFPLEPNPQYVLMQIFNENEDYEGVARTAKSYLDNKKNFLLDPFDKVKTLYMILKSDYLSGRYADAASLFSECDAESGEIMNPEDYVLWLRYGVQIFEKLNNKEQTLLLADRFSGIYQNEEWGYDSLMEDVELAKAGVLYHSGNLKEAHAVLEYIRSFSDYNPLADEYKNSWKKPGLFSKFGF